MHRYADGRGKSKVQAHRLSAFVKTQRAQTSQDKTSKQRREATSHQQTTTTRAKPKASSSSRVLKLANGYYFNRQLRKQALGVHSRSLWMLNINTFFICTNNYYSTSGVAWRSQDNRNFTSGLHIE